MVRGIAAGAGLEFHGCYLGCVLTIAVLSAVAASDLAFMPHSRSAEAALRRHTRAVRGGFWRPSLRRMNTTLCSGGATYDSHGSMKAIHDKDSPLYPGGAPCDKHAPVKTAVDTPDSSYNAATHDFHLPPGGDQTCRRSSSPLSGSTKQTTLPELALFRPKQTPVEPAAKLASAATGAQGNLLADLPPLVADYCEIGTQCDLVAETRHNWSELQASSAQRLIEVQNDTIAILAGKLELFVQGLDYVSRRTSHCYDAAVTSMLDPHAKTFIPSHLWLGDCGDENALNDEPNIAIPADERDSTKLTLKADVNHDGKLTSTDTVKDVLDHDGKITIADMGKDASVIQQDLKDNIREMMDAGCGRLSCCFLDSIGAVLTRMTALRDRIEILEGARDAKTGELMAHEVSGLLRSVDNMLTVAKSDIVAETTQFVESKFASLHSASDAASLRFRSDTAEFSADEVVASSGAVAILARLDPLVEELQSELSLAWALAADSPRVADARVLTDAELCIAAVLLINCSRSPFVGGVASMADPAPNNM